MNLVLRIAIVICVLGWCLALPAEAAKKALLIGVGDYDGTEFDLDGPKNDVFAIKKVLTEHWAFEPSSVKILLNQDAKKDSILRELKALSTEASVADSIFIYFSGHGTSRYDEESQLPMAYSTGAIVPEDALPIQENDDILSKLIIGKNDLRPILLQLDDSGADIFIAFDSCYSGNATRSINAFRQNLPSRYLHIKDTTRAIGNEVKAKASQKYGSEQDRYPYRNIYFLSAASSREKAKDIDVAHLITYPTVDNQTHGAFTDALLRSLNGQLAADLNHDGQVNYAELKNAITHFMAERGYGHQPNSLPGLKEDRLLLSERAVLKTGKPLVEGKDTVTAYSTHQLTPLRAQIVSDNAEILESLKLADNIQWVATQPEVLINQDGEDYQLFNNAGDLLVSLEKPSPLQLLGRVRQEAWYKHFQQLLQQHAGFNMEFTLDESAKGSTTVAGEKIAFTLRAEKDMYLVLLDLDASGNLTLLYPYRAQETQKIFAHKVTFIPSANPEDRIIIQPPFGTDHFIAIGFNELPEFLDEFVGKQNISQTSEVFAKLQNLLQTPKTVYGYYIFDLQTIALSP